MKINNAGHSPERLLAIVKTALLFVLILSLSFKTMLCSAASSENSNGRISFEYRDCKDAKKNCFFLSLFIMNCTEALQRLQTPSNRMTGCFIE